MTFGKTEIQLMEAFDHIRAGTNVLFLVSNGNQAKYTRSLAASIRKPDHTKNWSLYYENGSYLSIVSVVAKPHCALGFQGFVIIDHYVTTFLKHKASTSLDENYQEWQRMILHITKQP